ncbi:MAG: hypothetical protein IIT98_05505 [Kiritimatiellae bacterium]|nr:hypothetical protein [Kiritimatiellia bacterium]
MSFAKKAFTLVEVNLAMFIMAGGILSVIGLYSLGHRESRQSREDVASAAYADAVIGQLAMALSDTNLSWSTWKNLPEIEPQDGWGSYIDKRKGVIKGDPTSLAKATYGKIKGGEIKLRSWPDGAKGGSTGNGGLHAGLVFSRSGGGENGEDGAIATIAFKAARNEGELMTAPVYYTEVRFQGRRD